MTKQRKLRKQLTSLEHTYPALFPRQQQMQIHWQTYYFCAAQSICTHHFHIYASHSACVNDLMETSATDTRRLQHKGLRQLRTPTHFFLTALTACAKLEYSFVGSWGPAHETYIYDTYTNIGNASTSLVPAAKEAATDRIIYMKNPNLS